MSALKDRLPIRCSAGCTWLEVVRYRNDWREVLRTLQVVHPGVLMLTLKGGVCVGAGKESGA